MRFITVVCPALAFILMCSIPAFGFSKNYSPFEKCDRPASKHLTKMSSTKGGDETDGKGVTISYTQLKPQVGPDDEDYDSRMVFTLFRDGKVIIDRRLVGEVYYNSPSYAGDLNGDGKNDFLLTGESTACGLGGAHSDVVLVLSRDYGYDMLEFDDWFVDPQNFVDMKGDGGCQYIKTEFVQGGGHSFWVYRILELKDNRFKDADNMYPRFPKWVMYALKENHKAANLNEKQKRLFLSGEDRKLGYINEFLPFDEDKTPKAFPLEKCKVLSELKLPDETVRSLEKGAGKDSEFERMSVTCTDGHGTEVKTWVTNQNDTFFTLTKDGKTLIDKFHIGNYTEECGTVWCGDMNRDGVADFFIQPYAYYEWGELAVALSSGGSYKPYRFRNFFGGPENFVYMNGDGGCQYVHTALVEIDSSYSYLVYDIIDIKGDRMYLADSSYDGFPKWSLFYKPPGKKDRRLTKKLKDCLWDPEEKIFIRPGDCGW